MKFEFKTMFRVYLAALVCLLFWSVWRSGAQNETNAAAAVAASQLKTNTVTVFPAHVPVLITPDWIERLSDTLPFLKIQLWGNELWKYLFSLIYIFLAFYVSKLLDFTTRIWLKRWAEKTETKFDDLLLELLNGPIKIVTFVIFLRIGLAVFQWPDLVQKVLTKSFTVVVAISLIYMAMKFVDLMVSYWRLRTKNANDKEFDQQLFPIIRKSLKLIVVVVGVLVTLDNLNVNITAALASLSIGGLAVGLAAQDTLANLFGAIAVYADKPFHLGDAIQMDVATGTVESIGMRSTRVRSADGFLIAIPNKTMGNATITNVSRRPSIRTEMNISLPYNTSAEKIRRAVALVEEVYRKHPQTADLTVYFNKFTDTSLNILVVHMWANTDGKAYQIGLQELNLKLKEKFDAEGIMFVMPAQTQYLPPNDPGKAAAQMPKPAAS